MAGNQRGVVRRTESFSSSPRSGKNGEEWRAICLQIVRRYRNQGSAGDRGVLATECRGCDLHGLGEGPGEGAAFFGLALFISRSWPCRHCPQDAPRILGISLCGVRHSDGWRAA